MTKSLSIGIAGVALNNGNLGCQALGYSSVAMLERVAQALGSEFHYTIFEMTYGGKSEAALNTLCTKVGVPHDRIKVVREVGWDHLRTPVRHPKLALARRRMIRELRGVDVVFDLTQGDSFTDMYDDGARLTSFARTREAAFKTGVPVILGPQTIGPFNTEHGKEIARRTLRSAAFVIARDALSSECAKHIAGIDAPVTTDLAFGLPYEKSGRRSRKVPSVGLNPSGLLVSNAIEGGLDTAGFATDYEKFLRDFCDWLDDEAYDVHLISHVNGADYPVCARIKDAHPRFVLHDEFDNPVDAKSLISQMDVFVGSRMHAAIAALSTGVPVVPLAYSRKFAGLFGSLGYEVNLDLRKESTDDVLTEAEELVRHYADLKPAAEAARMQADKLLCKTRDILAEYCSSLI